MGQRVDLVDPKPLSSSAPWGGSHGANGETQGCSQSHRAPLLNPPGGGLEKPAVLYAAQSHKLQILSPTEYLVFRLFSFLHFRLHVSSLDLKHSISFSLVCLLVPYFWFSFVPTGWSLPFYNLFMHREVNRIFWGLGLSLAALESQGHI